jgi:hypothetical protein
MAGGRHLRHCLLFHNLVRCGDEEPALPVLLSRRARPVPVVIKASENEVKDQICLLAVPDAAGGTG